MTYTDRVLAQLLEEHGWQVGTSLENRVAWRLHRSEIRLATDCVQQMRIGRYRVDFAFPGLEVILEADGWYHRSPDAAARDAERDRWLRRQGWLVFRINDDQDEEVFLEQVSRVLAVVHALAPRRRKAAA